ncbi:MAG: hypothetical protein ACLU8D_02825 [Enterocloster sp.]
MLKRRAVHKDMAEANVCGQAAEGHGPVPGRAGKDLRAVPEEPGLSREDGIAH